MRLLLKKFFVVGSLVCGVSSTMALTTPTFPTGAAPSPNPATITVHPPILLGGQWFDTYFRNAPDGLSSEAIASANCVVVFYHGGGFHGGNPRGADADPAMIRHFVEGRGCILIMASYSINPTNSNPDFSDPANNLYTIPQIIGTPSTNQSVFGSFNALYTQHLQGWMQFNPNLKLWTAGGSAGTILAQRVAASGNWPVSQTVLFAPVVKNPSYHDQSLNNPLGYACETRMRNAGDCPSARFLWEYNSWTWTAAAAVNDLSYYATTTPASVQTDVVINACDEVADLGSFMKGYFNYLNPSKRRLFLAKGNSKQQINQALGISGDDRGYKSGQHASPGVFMDEYYQNYTSFSSPSSKWTAFNVSSLPEIESQYIKYCDTGVSEDTTLFRSYLIN